MKQCVTFLLVFLTLLLIFVPGPGPSGIARASDDELATMQREIERLNQDSVQRAAELLQKMETGDPTALPGMSGGGKGGLGGPVYWFFMIFISITGMGFYWSGKRSGDLYFTLCGLVMMVYPYIVTEVWTFAGLGLFLVCFPFLMRRF